MAKENGRGVGENAAAFERRKPAQQRDVREVQASVAKTHFSQLLDEVERGATIVILRHGRPVARLSPDPEQRRQQARQAIENIRKLGEQVRKESGSVTIAEIISSIHEGHKY